MDRLLIRFGEKLVLWVLIDLGVRFMGLNWCSFIKIVVFFWVKEVCEEFGGLCM